ncbi:hypothetical protein [Enterobacter kobei]|uniref:hypothetical protein n=1 Tax=Enterobacter kobei TaxID=208224 RepID=UPI002A7FC914|nr:hypothetical protein [Enterobacter kobei]
MIDWLRDPFWHDATCKLPGVLATTGTPTGQEIPLLDTRNYQHALPRYLLAPEVAALLHYLPDWPQHALINLL